MTLAAGIRLGPYEIESPLCAGGMGELYRARDTRLDRSVAIMILPSRRAQVLLGGESLANTGFIDIPRDGQRILLGQPQPNANTGLTLILNWAAVLKK